MRTNSFTFYILPLRRSKCYVNMAQFTISSGEAYHRDNSVCVPGQRSGSAIQGSWTEKWAPRDRHGLLVWTPLLDSNSSRRSTFRFIVKICHCLVGYIPNVSTHPVPATPLISPCSYPPALSEVF